MTRKYPGRAEASKTSFAAPGKAAYRDGMTSRMGARGRQPPQDQTADTRQPGHLFGSIGSRPSPVRQSSLLVTGFSFGKQESG